ncbi:helix-turn-helix domain-containing protein [Paenibacillus macquariensis]|uniref:HTH cro/C1-type domain-containing protein n=1 Tax=Paenibacillus macquariensis TaxID=948756 RepID=A0ABY1KES8_9BACL|nr:helix-turn-helix transcriptional regulator [Paenibacillus macquariensis]MEC0092473.1 helix-turn-helix transcriptional regulator [Paenibacillus macquariensis]OAB35432.1 hypothetical protein PMSM_09250 [Paenibacillus macquariensis subsp. macquariensis]SIR72687.1 hypothetical protein SAMN05421578_14812 [Paenibacillus macquariensis]
MTFKITLRAARINRGLTLKDVSEKTSRCTDTISKYEADATYVPHDLMVMLLELYDVPYIHIFFGNESEFLGLRKKKIS